MTNAYREEDYQLVHESIIENMRVEYDIWSDIKENAKKLAGWSGVDVCKSKIQQIIRRANKIRP